MARNHFLYPSFRRSPMCITDIRFYWRLGCRLIFFPLMEFIVVLPQWFQPISPTVKVKTKWKKLLVWKSPPKRSPLFMVKSCTPFHFLKSPSTEDEPSRVNKRRKTMPLVNSSSAQLSSPRSPICSWGGSCWGWWKTNPAPHREYEKVALSKFLLVGGWLSTQLKNMLVKMGLFPKVGWKQKIFPYHHLE